MPEVAEMKGGQQLKSHEDLYNYSLKHPDRFWGALARSRLKWITPFKQVSQCDVKQGKFNWFADGQLNVTENCLDRHAQQTPGKIALIWEKDEPNQHQKITYRQLYNLTNKLANTLKRYGVKKGDRVAIYMPVSPLAVAAMLGCARIGAVHSIVFAGFSADALATRINDAKAEILITSDQAVRGGKVIEIKKMVDSAVERCPSIRHVFVAKRTGKPVPMGQKDVALEEAMAKEGTECPSEVMNSEDPLFMLYTSGSTGKPKGIIHSQAGYLLYASVTHKHVFDYHEGDIFGCVADVGWITGHSYVVYGPLCNGGTTLLFESTPVYPDPGRYWETVQRLRLTHFYGAPTAIRLLLKHGDEWVSKYDRSSLRVLGSVGEPLNHEAWDWYNEVVGERKCTIVDTWWQTETGGICISPRPSAPAAKILGGMPMRPMFGIDPVLVNEQGQVIEKNDVPGALCISQPWPGIARTLFGDHKRFMDTYFTAYPGLYFSGDGAFRDENGYYQITGRMDDVINVTGHRLGTAEIEDALDNHNAVAESAVVGFPHHIKGEGVYAFVILKNEIGNDHKSIKAELCKTVKSQIAAYAVPEVIQICLGLPKTRSGKIMRRILRKVAANRSHELGDITTLADSEVVEQIVKDHAELLSKAKT